jgi:predicted NodU family carbamoyl transferase
MNVLSFMYGSGCHDTAAAIVCDGYLVAAAEEERFSRNKHERGFPRQAIAYCLREAGLRMSQIDVLAFPELPYWTGPDSYYADMDWSDLRNHVKNKGAKPMEFIQKALASILRESSFRARFAMDPHVADVVIRDRVNRLKGREAWRPLAPVVPAERASEYFNLKCPSPFMLLACGVREEVRTTIPGVTHIDGSARPQTVTRQQNPALYELLLAFERHAGVPILLNTSFNTAGEPVVCTPEEAIQTFLRAEFDALVLEDILVERLSVNSVSA